MHCAQDSSEFLTQLMVLFSLIEQIDQCLLSIVYLTGKTGVNKRSSFLELTYILNISVCPYPSPLVTTLFSSVTLYIMDGSSDTFSMNMGEVVIFWIWASRNTSSVCKATQRIRRTSSEYNRGGQNASYSIIITDD